MNGKLFLPLLTAVRRYGAAFLRWLALGLIVGVLCGNLGALFALSISCVTGLREQHWWLLLLLPMLGLVSVWVYRRLGISNVGTNQVLDSLRSERRLPFKLAPAVFIGSVLSHLGGASAGREGAALQLGGSLADLVCRLFRLGEKQRHILTMCGMGALFSAVFQTPVGACIFALEVANVGSLNVAAFFPVFISSLTAYGTVLIWGLPGEHLPLASVPALGLGPLWRIVTVAVLCAVLSALFVQLLHGSERLARRAVKSDYLRILLGGAIIVGLTLALGTFDYNGGGMPVIERIFSHGQVEPAAFFWKMLFTAVTVAAGFKGGEIIPTFFIGATAGASLALLLGLEPALGAAIGMVALFCGVTNCPLASIFLAVELFGGQGLIYFALASVSSFLMSGHGSLYSTQLMRFSKLDHQRLEDDGRHT